MSPKKTTAELSFFDASTYIGLPIHMPSVGPGGLCATAKDLLAEMDRSGIEKALVWHVAQRDHEPQTGNRLLAEAIAPHKRLAGCWAILTPQTHELGDVDEWLAAAGKARVKAFRAFPDANRYLLRADALGDLLERLQAARAPLLLPVGKNVSWENAYNLLADMPELTVVLADVGNWGCDRFVRPLVERYPNVYLEMSGYFVDGGIESFVKDYGAKRLLFGTGFPESYHGGNMLAVAHADIAPADKKAIASGNLERLLKEVRL